MNIDNLPIEWSEDSISSIIKVIGVGGGGGNAVNHMYKQGIHNVNFVICNTDSQDLDKSPVPVKIKMGELGVGGNPVEGRKAAIDHMDRIREVLENSTKMVFLTAGMGGGTGTGATPVIARVAKELGILTVAIVTIPFDFEGPLRRKQALEGINALKEFVDSLLVINNDKLFEMYSDLKFDETFAKADNVLTMAAKGIAELITLPGKINVDFKDVNATMSGGGITVMGSATASGTNRAREAVEAALNSPLLNNNDITGARRILLNITSGTGENRIGTKEVHEITSFVRQSAKNAAMIFGVGNDEKLESAICVTIVATDFQSNEYVDPILEINQRPKPVKQTVILPGDNNAPDDGASFSAENIHLGADRSYKKGNFIVREKNVSAKTETKWDFNDTDTDTAVAPRSTYETKRVVPCIVDENANINELEDIPAFERQKKKIDSHRAVERELSKYTLSPDRENNTVRLRDNNSYLHDVSD